MKKTPDNWVTPIDQWTSFLSARGFPASTVELRSYHLRRFAGDHPTVDPWDVTLGDVVRWFTERGDRWGNNTRRSVRSSLRTFYTWAIRTGRAVDDPTEWFAAPKARRPVPRPTPEYVIRRTLNQTDDRVHLMVLLAATCSMRRGEITRAHTDWIEGYDFRIPGKGDQVRIVPIPANVQEEVNLLPRGYFFPKPGTDEPMTPAHVGKLISRALGPGWTAHTLRHRYATKAYEPERDLIAVQELMGHAKIETTRIYTAVPDGAKRRAAAGAEIWAA